MRLLHWSDRLTLSDRHVQFVSPGPGVYVLWQTGIPKPLCAFVGRADNLRRRIGDHLLPDELHPILADLVQAGNVEFQWAAVGHPDLCARAERFLFDWYRPQHNGARPDREPLPCTLPDAPRT